MDRRLRGALLHLDFARAALGGPGDEMAGSHFRNKWQSSPQTVAIIIPLKTVHPRDAAAAFLDLLDLEARNQSLTDSE